MILVCPRIFVTRWSMVCRVCVIYIICYFILWFLFLELVLLLGSHLETLLLTIKSITISSALSFSSSKPLNSSDSQSGNISTKLVNSGDVLLLPLNLFSWFLKVFRFVDILFYVYVWYNFLKQRCLKICHVWFFCTDWSMNKTVRLINASTSYYSCNGMPFC